MPKAEKPMAAEIDCSTGEIVYRELTPAEIAQRDQDAAAAAEMEAARLAEEEAKAATKQSAVEKLTAMGLTEEEALAIING